MAGEAERMEMDVPLTLCRVSLQASQPVPSENVACPSSHTRDSEKCQKGNATDLILDSRLLSRAAPVRKTLDNATDGRYGNLRPIARMRSQIRPVAKCLARR